MKKCCIKEIIDFKKESISISDLCRSVGISRTYFYRIIDNHQYPSVFLAIKITDYLNDCLELNGYPPNCYDVSQFWVE